MDYNRQTRDTGRKSAWIILDCVLSLGKRMLTYCLLAKPWNYLAIEIMNWSRCFYSFLSVTCRQTKIKYRLLWQIWSCGEKPLQTKNGVRINLILVFKKSVNQFLTLALIDTDIRHELLLGTKWMLRLSGSEFLSNDPDFLFVSPDITGACNRQMWPQLPFLQTQTISRQE
jgi:hypothetical protein